MPEVVTENLRKFPDGPKLEADSVCDRLTSERKAAVRDAALRLKTYYPANSELHVFDGIESEDFLE